MKYIVSMRMTFAIALVMMLTATGLWATGADEGSTAAAADKKYVTDPTTGKVVSAPEYGGTLTFAMKAEFPGTDSVLSGGGVHNSSSLVVEKLAMADWATPRDKLSFKGYSLMPPANTKGVLAESWSQPDPLTIIVKVRQGVHWHDKAPMNGRELTADDIEFNYNRVLGVSSKRNWGLGAIAFESVEATDKSTVVFKLKEPNLVALASILDDWWAWIYPPEVIKEHGDVGDWRNLVGTGPMMLTDKATGSSMTWEKNPDYWGYDEKYPENRLPYVDEIRALIMPDPATIMAALRTAKVDYIGTIAASGMNTLDQVESLQRTNPEIVIWPHTGRADYSFGVNVQKPPFDDIRVRKALQMAINLEEINNALFKGHADAIPQGQINRSYTDVVTQFEDWPEDVKKVFDYDPEGAEALLDEAGYPRGADGIRFKTTFLHIAFRDLGYNQLIFSYLNKIGIDVEIAVLEVAAYVPRRDGGDFEMIANEMAHFGDPLANVRRYLSSTGPNTSNVNDPVYEAMYEAAEAAATLDERNRIAGEMDQYSIEQFWSIWTPNSPTFNATQPWIIGFNNENWFGTGQIQTVFTRLWIDSELKEAMGH